MKNDLESANTATVGYRMSGKRVESIIEVAWRRKALFLGVLFLTLMGAAIALIMIPKRTAAEGQIMITPSGKGIEKTTDELRPFLNTQSQLIKSPTILGSALEAPNVDTSMFFDGARSKLTLLKDKLEVEPMADASIIKVRLATRNKDESRLIVGAVMQSYVSFVETQKKNPSLDLYNRIVSDRGEKDKQREDAQKKLNSLQKDLAMTAKDTDEATNLAIQKRRHLADSVNTAQADTSRIKTQFDEALRLCGWTPENYDDKKLSGATAVSASSLAMLQQNLAKMNQQLIEAKRRFVPTHPAVRTVQNQIKDLHLSQAATLRSMYVASVGAEKEFRQQLVQQEEIVKNLNANAAELENWSGRVASLDSQIKILDDKLRELTVNEDVGYTAQELTAAEIDEASATPDTWKTLGMAAIVGSVLGLLVTMLTEWVNPAIGAVHRISDTVGVPLLGTLPRLPGKSAKDIAIFTHDRFDAPQAEAFRSVRTSLLFGGGNCNTLAITSAGPKDGKTTFATNLSISLAQSGKRVVLVDANFKDPMLHTIFELDNGIGMTAVLTGDDLETTLRRTPIEHLDVLTAGPKASDISERLNSRQFNELITELSRRYDHVIFDNSSATTNNDARVIAASCDQTVLVVRGEKANRFAVAMARDALLSVGASLMGIVVNDSMTTGQAYPPAGDRRDAAGDRASEVAARLRSTR